MRKIILVLMLIFALQLVYASDHTHICDEGDFDGVDYKIGVACCGNGEIDLSNNEICDVDMFGIGLVDFGYGQGEDDCSLIDPTRYSGGTMGCVNDCQNIDITNCVRIPPPPAAGECGDGTTDPVENEDNCCRDTGCTTGYCAEGSGPARNDLGCFECVNNDLHCNYPIEKCAATSCECNTDQGYYENATGACVPDQTGNPCDDGIVCTINDVYTDPGGLNCAGVPACATGQLCQDNSGVPACLPCTDASQCAFGETCNAGLCELDTTNFGETNMIISDGVAHICGDNADTDPTDDDDGQFKFSLSGGLGSIAELHHLCDVVMDEAQVEYTCAADDNGWQWFEFDPQGDPVVPLMNRGLQDNTWSEVVSGLGGSDPLVTGGAIACVGGQAVPAIRKFGPPPAANTGLCAASQCYDDVQTKCVDVGANMGGKNYFCERPGGSANAVWVSVVSKLADTMLDRVGSDDFVLNCGPASEFSVNEFSSPERGYCELAILNGIPSFNPKGAKNVITGIALSPSADLGALRGQVGLINPLIIESDLTCSSATGCDIYDFDDQLNFVYFAGSDLGGISVVVSDIWTWITGMFSPTPPAIDPFTQSAEQIFVSRIGGTQVQYAVEYTNSTTCPQNSLVMLSNTGTSECYDRNEWKRIVQVR